MTHLSVIERTRPNRDDLQSDESMSSMDETIVVTKIIESNPIMEAFGNAKTPRNDNSSRFGKFQRLQFDIEDRAEPEGQGYGVPKCQMAGCSTVTYLLEKSRVVDHQQTEERGFHIFYQFFSASEAYRQELWPEGFPAGTTASDFKYLGSDDVDALPGVSDTDNWVETLHALKLFGFDGDELRDLLRALCVVLQLGNITFSSAVDGDRDGGSSVTSPEELSKLCDLLGCASAGDLTNTFTKSTVMPGGGRGTRITKLLSPRQAKEACDAFAKEIYSRVFDRLVRRINSSTDAREGATPERAENFGYVSLLDIFGFEKFKKNRFEQLCINYCNERVQNRYVFDNFRTITDEYVAEGLDMSDLFDLRLVDNSDVIDLLGGKIGLIIALNEECVRVNGNNETFVYKMKVVHENSDRLVSDRLQGKTDFAIKHYADTVKYDASKFVERNTDKLPLSLIELGCTSQNNKLIKEEFLLLKKETKAARSGPSRKRSAQTVLSKFRTQLNALMTSIDGTKTRYIRCIKPNSNKQPRILDQKATMSQLESAGLVTAIVITRESFPKNMAHCVITERFAILAPGGTPLDCGNTDDAIASKVEAERIVQTLLPPEPHDGRNELPWRVGKNKIFFRPGVLERIEIKLQAYVDNYVVRIQTFVRGCLARMRRNKIRESVIKLQSLWRGQLALDRYKKQYAAIWVIQRAFRFASAKTELTRLRLDSAATKIQSLWRCYRQKKEWIEYINAARVIQQFIKYKTNKVAFNAAMFDIVQLVRTDRRRAELKSQICQAVTSPTSVDSNLMTEVDDVYTELLAEVNNLRSKHMSLKDKLYNVEERSRAQESKMFATQQERLVANKNASRMEKVHRGSVSEMSRLKQVVLEIKATRRKEMAEQEGTRNESQEEMKRNNEEEIVQLRALLEAEKRDRAEERTQLQVTMEMQMENERQMRFRLTKDLKETQDAHQEYLSKLMKVLESTHRTREEEAERQKDELEAMKTSNDEEVYVLRSEVLKVKGQLCKTSEDNKELLNLRAENSKLLRQLEINKMQTSSMSNKGSRNLGRGLGRGRGLN